MFSTLNVNTLKNFKNIKYIKKLFAPKINSNFKELEHLLYSSNAFKNYISIFFVKKEINDKNKKNSNQISLYTNLTKVQKLESRL